MLRLSVLDQSVAVVGRPHGQSNRDTVALAVVDNLIAYVGGKPPKTPVPEAPFKGGDTADGVPVGPLLAPL